MSDSRVTVRYWSGLFAHFGLVKCLVWTLESFFNMVLSPLPFAGGALLRRIAYRPLLKRSGERFLTAPGVKLLHSYNISMGDRVNLGHGTMLNGRGGLTIGNDFVTGPDVIVWTVEHNHMDAGRRILEQGETDAPVVIGNDVRCGARAMIMPGVRIADGTIVVAGALVLRDTLPRSVVAGIPAMKIGERDERGRDRERTR